MRCSRFRKLIVITNHSERSSRLQQQLDEHQQRCPQCCEFARRMGSIELLLRGLPAECAPESFSEQLCERLSQCERPQRVSWYQRVWGDLKRPAPVVQPAVAGLVGVAAIVILVSLGGIFLRSGPLGPSPTPTSEATVAAADLAAPIWEELENRHRRYVLERPLADDPGLQLVSYPLPTE